MDKSSIDPHDERRHCGT